MPHLVSHLEFHNFLRSLKMPRIFPRASSTRSVEVVLGSAKSLMMGTRNYLSSVGTAVYGERGGKPIFETNILQFNSFGQEYARLLHLGVVGDPEGHPGACMREEAGGNF